MRRNWLELAGDRFANSVKAIIDKCADSLNSSDLGDEDTQCQHLFTSIFTMLRTEEHRLSQLLITDSKICDLRVEFRYFRSCRRKNHHDKRIQFIESETGADFALGLMVDLKDIACAQRHVLAQVKLIKNGAIRINRNQLDLLERSAGGEQGLYAMWGEANSPNVVTVANMKAVMRAASCGVRANAIKRFGRALSDYVVEDFLGLWHGADYYANEYGDHPPTQSPPVLYHLLHGGEPPANVSYFGIYNTNLFDLDLSPGFHVQGKDLTSGTLIL
ncbi:MAG: hypothetical protein NTX50_29525 [Candidatus Sumerlaeota bacterium]|nr:hypothetical protein [Candidatus Sumerlaeota bacterium]